MHDCPIEGCERWLPPDAARRLTAMGRLRPLLGLDCWDELMRTHRYFTLWTAACTVGGCAIELLHVLG